MNRVAATLVVAILVLISLRLPSLVDPLYYLDEGVYASVAYEIGQGGTLYKTAWDLKPPGIFYIYLFFQALFGPHAFLAQRIFNLALGVLTVLGVFKLVKRLGLHGPGPRSAAFLTAIFLGLPFFEGHIFNTENIFIVTSLWGFVLGLDGNNSKWRGQSLSGFLSGFLFGVGQWLKIHPIFDLAAFGIFALAKFRLDKKFWLPFILGVLTPILGMIVFLAVNGILEDFWETNLAYNLYYIEELPQINLFGDLLTRTLLLLLMTTTAVFVRFKKKISEAAFLVLLWLLFTLYGALLSARAYNHYFIPVLIPMVLLLSLIVAKSAKLRNVLRIPLAAAFLLIPFIGFSILDFTNGGLHAFKKRVLFEQYDFYTLRISYLMGSMSSRDFEEQFNPQPWRLRELRTYLDANVATDERVYIWGNSPWAPYVLKRRPAQRYLMWFHVLGVGNREEEVLDDLASSPPGVIVVEEPNSRPPFAALQEFINQNYQFQTAVANYKIYNLTSTFDRKP